MRLLRDMIRSTGAISLLILGILMVWFTLRFSWHVAEFLERELFTGW